MSWRFDLCDPVTKETIEVDFKHHIQGATIAVGGTNELSINITYNYSDIICNKFSESLKELELTDDSSRSYAYYMSGRTGAETIPILKKTIDKLGNDVDDDYWKATEGNAKRALCGLLAFAQMRPDGIWSVC